ncbi:Tropomyosin-2 [Verticillium dahliae VDG1]|nr:Tropomyosin-2 [Verticillium dahliae VDG1]
MPSRQPSPRLLFDNWVHEAFVRQSPAELVFARRRGSPGVVATRLEAWGEIVNAACVNEAADRQVTPSTQNGTPVLVVQRAFSAGFRPDLVGVQACVGFNGTHFRAEDCAAEGGGVELVGFTGANVVASGGACLDGHDERAQVTVDVAGNDCAVFTPTVVTPTAP